MHEMAFRNGIVLTNEHLGVIECLRDYYLEFGEAETGRDLEEMLSEIFAGQCVQRRLVCSVGDSPAGVEVRSP